MQPPGPFLGKKKKADFRVHECVCLCVDSFSESSKKEFVL